MLRRISRAKNDGQCPDELERVSVSDIDRQIARVYRKYEAALAERNAIDMDDLTFRPLRSVLQADETIARFYKNR